ncbi:protein RD3 [Simochromis diagramma]|uniref:Retinal degeneration 3, GUCY2D regulator n=1 Tax=Haplochromis burtoni TaxID=8153 RepID=A0A3Q2X8Y2_HAPBU|nr:protein RD3 [Haplochromis burtoni]XP_039873745.1 protein RD3 [Simochromis diagramma]XP_039873746.1 protein RD3 [Simochromis diagramma]XP_039873747.1 protein RD3 [Simochromis diagramma]XP_039873748.1 protein RD3 [Simochromis diagramma]XP_039873749.1 protein RD3 [Simochromis diagramma]XP_039873750.1 protein RD3 [Simochromis diagramma]
MASWFSWNEPYYRSPRRDPADVVTDTLMLEFSWQLKESEKQQRERENEYRRTKTGVDYSWLASTPRSTYNISTGERLGLEDLCAKVPPSCCGLVILKFREAMQANEPEVHEVSGLFRSVLMEALDHLKEEQEAERLARQWNNKRAMSVSLMNFRSRIKINPFGSTVGLTTAAAEGAGLSDLKTVSEDVERGMDKDEKMQRVWSMPDFRYKGTGSSKIV